MRKRPLGELEFEVLQYVSNHSPSTVRSVADDFAESQGLARTTVLTVMDRLRKKGYLARRKEGGTFVYTPSHEQGEVMHEVVKDFVENTLGGSLTPFVAYLARSKGLSDSEVGELQELVDSMAKGEGVE